MQISVFIRYLILTRGIEEGLLASTREKHNTGLGKVTIQSLYFCKLCYKVSAAKNFRVKYNSMSCAVSWHLNRCLKTCKFHCNYNCIPQVTSKLCKVMTLAVQNMNNSVYG